jgi:hypothetical protein
VKSAHKNTELPGQRAKGTASQNFYHKMTGTFDKCGYTGEAAVPIFKANTGRSCEACPHLEKTGACVGMVGCGFLSQQEVPEGAA